MGLRVACCRENERAIVDQITGAAADRPPAIDLQPVMDVFVAARDVGKIPVPEDADDKPIADLPIEAVQQRN